MRRESTSFAMRAVLVLMTICLLVGMLAACNGQGDVESIEVVESSNAGYYMLDGFNISTLKLQINYENDTSNIMNVEKTMLSTAAQNELKTSGYKEITINYKGKTTTVSFYLAAEGEQVVEVTFKDVNSNKIASVKTLVGGDVTDKVPEAPEVEGQYFEKWVDKDGKEVDLGNVQDSITVFPSYSVNVKKYTVTFNDYKGAEIKKETVPAGSAVYAPPYGKPAEVKSYSWNTTFPVIVNSDITLNMSVEYQYYSVDYAYAFESSKNDIVFLNLHEDVKYGEKAQNKSRAERQLPGTVATQPSDSETIYKNTTFLYILTSERVTITVYNNEDMTQVRTDAARYLVNSQYTFPTGTPAPVDGMTFAGWRLYNGSNKYSSVYRSGDTWKVNNTTYGNDIKVVPYYTTAYATVTFNFIFTDIVDGTSGQPYKYAKVISGVYQTQKSVIDYATVTSLLQSIKNTNNGNEVSDHSEAGGKAALAVKDCEIASIVYGGRAFTVDSSVTVNSSELNFQINLTSADVGTKYLNYTKVLALYEEPCVVLPAGDSVTEWKYGDTVIPCFPYVIGETSFTYGSLKYKTALHDSYVTAPGFYPLNVSVGDAVPENAWFEYNGASYVATEDTEAQTSKTYYGYYVPAGYAVASVTSGETVAADTYYVYNAGFALTSDTTFAAETVYFVRNYVENTSDWNSGYFFGYEVSAVNTSSAYYEEGANIYIPSEKTESEGGVEHTRPVVSVADSVFLKSTVGGVLSGDEATYIIAGLSDKLLKVGDQAFVGCYMYGLDTYPSLAYIGDEAFKGALLTDSVSFPALLLAGEEAFASLNIFNRRVTASFTFAKLEKVSDKMFEDAFGTLTITLNASYCKELGDRAFYSAVGLATVNGLDNIIAVGEYAFAETAFVTLDLPNVQTIGDYAFASMPNLVELSLGSNGTITQDTVDLSIIQDSNELLVLSIGRQDASVPQAAPGGAIAWDTDVKKLTGSLTGSDYKLETIKLPASLEIVGSTMFDAFPMLKEIVVPTVAENFFTDAGVLYSVASGTQYTLVCYPVNRTGDYVVALPEGATKITFVPDAFGDAEISVIDMTGASSVTVAVSSGTLSATIFGIKADSSDVEAVDTLSTLADVFVRTDLTDAEFADLVAASGWDDTKVFSASHFDYYYDATNKLLFEYDAVERTAALSKGYRYASSVTVPATIVIDNVTYTVNEIKAGAFYGYHNLTSLNVLATLAVFPEGVFGDGYDSCVNLTQMSFAGWASGSTEGNNAIGMDSFRYTAWFAQHTIIYAGGVAFGYNIDADDQELTAEELTEVGFASAIPIGFFKNALITSVVLPATLTTIENYAFSGCALLRSVDFGNVSAIGEEAFAGCVLLKEANVPALANLGRAAFSGCTSLTTFKAPHLKRMPTEAFVDCSDLKTVDLSGLNAFATDIDGSSNAFENCSSLEEIDLPSFTSDTLPGYVFVGTGLKTFDFTAYTSITTIGKQAFAQCGGLNYVLLSAFVTTVDEYAFDQCANLNVEITYSQKGLYIAKNLVGAYYEGTLGTDSAKIAVNAFDADTHFFVDGQADRENTFLKDYQYVQSTFPVVSFEFFNGNGIDFSFRNGNIGMSDIRDRIYLTEDDVTPPDLTSSGLSFVGWSTTQGSYTELTLPTVVTVSTTFYAKYISTLRGTLSATDVEYVYLITEEPEVFVESDEDGVAHKAADDALYTYVLHEVFPDIAKSYYLNGGEFITTARIGAISRERFTQLIEAAGFSDPESFMRINGISDEWEEVVSYTYKIKRANGVEEAEKTIASFPFVLHGVDKGDTVTVYTTVRAHHYMYTAESANCITEKQVETKKELGSLGEFGYAIVDYESTDSNVVLPTVYSDGQNGEANVIVLYAGAFGRSTLNLAKITLPETIKVIKKGYYSGSQLKLDRNSFNDNFTEIVLPEGLLYVEDGLFAGLKNLTRIEFGESSELIYVSKNSFLGTEWYKNAVFDAESGKNNGFIMAGRTVVEYVGKTSSLFIANTSELNYTDTDAAVSFKPGLNFGWTLEKNGAPVATQTLKLIVAYGNGNNSGVIEYVGSNGIIDETNGVYTITMEAAGHADISLILYARASGDKRVGDVKSVSFSSLPAQAASVRFLTKSGESVTLPASAIKLADGVLRDNTDMIKVTVNVALKYIGQEAFCGSALTTVMYNGSQENSNLVSVGKNAFADTPWYTATENVIIGTIYLKYNNTGTGQKYSGNSKKFAVTIPAYVTRIAAGAFANATGLGGVTFNGNKLTVIEQNAFAGSGIERITLPSSVKTLQRGAFKNCIALEDANLTATQITELPQDAFFGCTALTSVTLSTTVKTFGKNAFAKDGKLVTLTAGGIVSVDVNAGVEWDGTSAVGNLDGSALKDTAWYSPAQENEDRFIMLGSVLVKYVIGKDSVNSDTDVSVVVPSGTETILKQAFYKNTRIAKVTIPASVKTIGQSAFEGCDSLKEVVFSSGSLLNVIEASAFKDCSALTTIVLPDKLTRIEDQAFEATRITTAVRNDKGEEIEDDGFTIPDTVTYIGQSAFYGVTTLTYIRLGNSLTFIGKGAFNTNYTAMSGATESGILYKVIWNAASIEVNDSFDKLSSTLYAVSDTKLATDFFATGAGIVIRFYFPSALMSYIGGNEFWNTMESRNVGYICKESDNEESYPKVNLDFGGSSTEIYTELIKVGTLPTPVKENQTFVEWVIGDSAETGTPITYPFEVRQNSITLYARFIENNPDSSSDYTVSGDKIVSVKAGLETLYVPATYNGTTIKSIDLTAPNDTVKKIVFTKAANFNGLTTNIFANYTALERIEIPNDASYADFIVEEVELEKTEGVGANMVTKTYTFQVVYVASAGNPASKSKLIAFIGRAEGMEFQIPDGITEICEGAFLNSGLATVRIPSSVSKIGQDAFHKELQSLKIHKSIALNDVSYTAFSDRTNSSFWNKESRSSLVDNYVIVRGMRSNYRPNENSDMVYGYFYTMGNILLGYTNVSATNLDVPNTVGQFSLTVFASDIFNMDGAPSVSFVSMTLPGGIKKINASAFSNCDITSGIVNNNNNSYSQLTEIADDVFKNMTFYDNANHSMLILGRVLVKATFTDTSANESITVPDTVETIMKDAFNNSRATTIILPANLKRIGVEAFYSATNLTSITIPNTVTYIGKGAFTGCTNLTTVKFDSVKSALVYLGDKAFANCTSLRSLELPAKLQEIGDQAFYGCINLETVTFDGYEHTTDGVGGETMVLKTKSDLVSLGENAFGECSSLTSITIPDGLTEIKRTTFRNCVSLLTVEFGLNSRLKVIGSQAFYGCVKLGSKLNIELKPKVSASEEDEYQTNLITLDLPNSLTKVESNAFQGCTGLWGVQFNYNIDELGENIFYGCNNLVKINFYRSTPPTVKSNTFEIGDDAYYRLRIYVVPSESTGSDSTVTYGSTMENYINKWENVYINNESVMYFIYERGTLPTLTRNEVSYNEEYYIRSLAGTAVAEGWTYVEVKQKSEWYYGQSSNYVAASDTDRKDKKAVEYGQQRYNDGENTYVIIIVDYDEMTMVLR